ncbi:hypothetical protein EAE96_001082 [Botrytis aclada]|nr:hypothetical protein EAE96_001082 [Botrytis aclada]
MFKELRRPFRISCLPLLQLSCCGMLRLASKQNGCSAVFSPLGCWDLMDFITWKCVELGLSVIVGCLPTLRAIFDEKSWSRIYASGTGGYVQRSGGSGTGSLGSKKNMQILKSNEFHVEFGSTHQLQTGKISFGGPGESTEHV